MSCSLNSKIPKILNIEGIRSDKSLINAFSKATPLNSTQLKQAEDDFYNSLGINDPVFKQFLAQTFDTINNNRNIFSTLSDTAQCKHSIGPEFFGQECYLCGLPILPRQSVDPAFGMNDSNHPLYPECEHVLPYIYGALYLNLVTSKEAFNALPESIKQVAKMEYKWSHRCCNQLKNQAPFVKYSNEFQFEPDYGNIQCYLQELYLGNSAWSKHFQESVQYLGGPRPNDPNFFSQMQAAAGTHLPNLNKTIYDITTAVSKVTDGEKNFLRSIVIMSYLKYYKAIMVPGGVANLSDLKSSITDDVRNYIIPAWKKYKGTFRSIETDTRYLNESQLVDSLIDPGFFSFGKKTNKIKSMSYNELKTKLKSVGIHVTKINSSGKRIPLTPKEAQDKAKLFKNLQIRAKKRGIKLMYKSKNKGYIYKSYNRLTNELKKTYNNFGKTDLNDICNETSQSMTTRCKKWRCENKGSSENEGISGYQYLESIDTCSPIFYNIQSELGPPQIVRQGEARSSASSSTSFGG